jgi:hypothetical protein
VLIDSPTERTTAITDLVLFLECFILAVLILRLGNSKDQGRSGYWTSIFLLLGFASGTGALAHGLEMSDHLNRIMWMPLNFSLGLTISFVLGLVVLEIWGPYKSKKYLPYFIGLGVLFFLFTVLIPGVFLLFVIYEGTAMILALGAFIYLSRKTGQFHYKLIVGVVSAVIILSIIFGLIEAIGPQAVTIIWEFDQNSFFHVIQMMAMVVLFLGIRIQLNKSSSGKTSNLWKY